MLHDVALHDLAIAQLVIGFAALALDRYGAKRAVQKGSSRTKNRHHDLVLIVRLPGRVHLGIKLGRQLHSDTRVDMVARIATVISKILQIHTLAQKQAG